MSRQSEEQRRDTKGLFNRLIGLEPVEAGEGRALVRLPFSDQLLQSMGLMHGGAIFSAADFASGMAAHTMLGPEEKCVTLEMKINYIAAVTGEDCLAEARVAHKGRSSIVVECDVKTAAGQLVAKTLATFFVLRPR